MRSFYGALIYAADMLDAQGKFTMAQQIDSMILNTPVSEINMDIFNDRLNSYDWSYIYSDDVNVWKQGIENEKNIANMAEQLGQDAIELFNNKTKQIDKILEENELKSY